MALTMRSRSSGVANSTTILPLWRPISTLTRVSKRSDRRSASRRRPGATGCLLAGARFLRASSAPRETISSTLRTDRPSAMIRMARRSWAAGSSRPRRARAWPALSHAGSDALLDGRGEVEQPERVADVRAGAAYLLRELLVGGAEVVEQLLVGRRFLKGVELLAVQVLHQGVPQQVVVLRLLDDGADLGQPGPLGGTPPPLAHDELVTARSGRTDDHRLEQADLPDGFGELLEGVIVECPPRLARVRRDRGDRDLLIVSAEHFRRSGRGFCRPGRDRTSGQVLPPGGLAISQQRRLRDERAESPA